MVSIDPLTAGILGTVTVVGLLLTVAGYRLTDTLLNAIGWIGGGAAGTSVRSSSSRRLRHDLGR